MTLCNCCRLCSTLCNILDTMSQMLVLLAAAVVAVSARPSPGGLNVEPGSLQPYQYQYEVNVPETGDQKSHTEERDETGVVVGNFQVVDPNGDLRKLFYRVEGNSGFVITDQQVMRGFADPPPAPETYSNRQSTQDGSQGVDNGGQRGLVSDDGAGASQRAFSDQSSDGDADQFDDGVGSSSGNGDDGGSIGFNAFAAGNGGNGGNGFSDEGSFSSGESGGSSEGGDSFEGGSSAGGGSSEGGDSFEGGSSAGGGSSGESSSSSEGGLSEGQQLFTSGVSGTDGQNAQTGSSQPITSQASEVKPVKPFEFHGPAFTFSIQRTEPNRFAVKEKIIGHEVEFDTHGGRTRRGFLPIGPEARWG